MIGHDADGDYDGADGDGGDAKPLNDQKRLVLSPLIPPKDSQCLREAAKQSGSRWSPHLCKNNLRKEGNESQDGSAGLAGCCCTVCWITD